MFSVMKFATVHFYLQYKDIKAKPQKIIWGKCILFMRLQFHLFPLRT